MALTTERRRPRRIREAPNGWWLAIATVCFGAFMGQLDASIATLTYGALEGEFHTGVAAVSWVSLGYLLVLVALLVPVGRFSDAHGRKLCYLYGFVVFTAASAACGLAPGLTWLIAFRVVQAFGAALLQANSVALVTTCGAAHPDARRARRAGRGPGARPRARADARRRLVSTLGWRWVFLVNVPVGVIAVVAGHYLLPRTRDPGVAPPRSTGPASRCSPSRARRCCSASPPPPDSTCRDTPPRCCSRWRPRRATDSGRRSRLGARSRC